MPPRASYGIPPVFVRTRNLAILLVAPGSVEELKRDVLSALTSRVTADDPNIPKVHSVEDFELCRELKERGVPTGQYKLLDGRQPVKTTIAAYGHVFLRFREDGILLQPEYSIPPVQPDDEEPEPVPSSSKGKGKATF